MKAPAFASQPPRPSSVHDARICVTATGILIVREKALLIKHKKLGVWLCPGGHLEENELPHQAAEREFWEETGVKVRARIDVATSKLSAGNTTFVPSPISSNLHWFSYENYCKRRGGSVRDQKTPCQQHLALAYLMVPASNSLEYQQNMQETDGIGWFSKKDLEELDTLESVRSEVALAFELI